ncbi:Succinate-semialdehyde dehydrogenase, mitochondrial [Vitis vinifera]|uniref:Succinate-semialdehyde dehydrogenase, mitochondrial n=1 Tax=Vitis vinifera TaxID=29760 RepID=A0A438IAQ3_VITVI|nr:Succinate-semialdehyde dehydrogenase, mitochondrial [Vitis vinifera]
MDPQSAIAQVKRAGLFRTQGLIGGKWMDAYDGKTFEVYNPATGEVLANVACMGKKEANDAIASAHAAFTSWSKLTTAERSKLMRKWYDLLIAHQTELGQLITLEQGKPVAEGYNEVLIGASCLEFFLEEVKHCYGDIIPQTQADRRMTWVLMSMIMWPGSVLVLYRLLPPLSGQLNLNDCSYLRTSMGVVGAITPWNLPLAMALRKVSPAMACGCTVVIKPSELTPLSALAVAELALQAGIPPGVFNMVMGFAPEIGDAFLASPKVRAITFTGSTAVGKMLLAGAAQTVKKTSMELGGNAPSMIFDDADLEVTVKGLNKQKTLDFVILFDVISVLSVSAHHDHCGIHDKFAAALTKAVQTLRVGHGFDEGVTQGPLINQAALHKIEALVEDAVSQGAKVLVGGKRHSLGLTFYEPTVLVDVTSDMLISSTEIFGPVLALQRFKTEEEAIHLANDSNAGLAGYIYTENLRRCWRVAEAIEFGIVGVNDGLIPAASAPFGGFKQSGLGREGSKYGLDDFLESIRLHIPSYKFQLQFIVGSHLPISFAVLCGSAVHMHIYDKIGMWGVLISVCLAQFVWFLNSVVLLAEHFSVQCSDNWALLEENGLKLMMARLFRTCRRSVPSIGVVTIMSNSVHNPATGEVIADVPCMGQPETNDAISSAYEMFNFQDTFEAPWLVGMCTEDFEKNEDAWSKVTAIERSQCLWKWHDLLIAHKEELGQLITLEQGKPLNEAIIEVIIAAGYLEFFAEEAKHVYSDIIPSTVADCQLFVIKQPVGVVGAITPWNFPLAMLTSKVGPALACGCTVVLEPSELTPLIAFAAAGLALEAGIPSGALNVVTGNAPDIEHALLASPKVRKITFTGLSAVEKKIMPGAGETLRKVSLEPGGNAPCIVFDDTDLGVAVKSILWDSAWVWPFPLKEQ